MVLSETSHPKEDRPQWMDMIARECMATFEANVPLLGVCWYPILDRPDWDNLHDWHRAGIWERASGVDGEYDRALHKPTAEAFLRAQVLLENYRPRTGARALDAVGATA